MLKKDKRLIFRGIILKLSFFILIILLSTFIFACNKKGNKQQSFNIDKKTPVLEEKIAEVWKNIKKGEIVYVPVYPRVYTREGITHDLTVMLSIHNINLKKKIYVTSIRYYNTKGNLIRHYLKNPISLKPLETTYMVLLREDKAGGSGANALVEWISDDIVQSPLIEAVMISAKNQLGISISREGVVIHEYSISKPQRIEY